jgi:sugar lactone lactonase YvrE
MGFDVEVVAELNSDLGEGPCWDHASQSLLFVDVTPGHIYRLDHATGALHRAEFGQEVGAAIPDSAGGLVVAARDGIYQADHSGNKVSLLAAVEADKPGNRMNDAKCDPSGRLWAGTMAFDFRQGAASLYRIDHTAVTTMLTDLTISNGTGWSPDGGLMYFIDSATFRIDVFDFDGGTGDISARRPFVTGTAEEGLPDGMTVDSEGGVWVAYFGAGQVRRFAPSGQLDSVVDLPVRQVTSCCFGGRDLRELYITSAAYQLSAADLREQPLSGSTFRCTPGIAGLPTSRFEV